MKRREFFGQAGGLPIAATLPMLAREEVPRDKKEYEICKVRGHVADPAFGASSITLSIYIRPVPKPTTVPGYVDEGGWQTCYYCHTQFRIVTRLEEKPEEK